VVAHVPVIAGQARSERRMCQRRRSRPRWSSSRAVRRRP
jgi:hypothetical protein